uniref:Uncharacterized protein n=1 Tax=Amblyomma maculatum TaxID=34609 RepID=G3MQZ2_AMBMU
MHQPSNFSRTIFERRGKLTAVILLQKSAVSAERPSMPRPSMPRPSMPRPSAPSFQRHKGTIIRNSVLNTMLPFQVIIFVDFACCIYGVTLDDARKALNTSGQIFLYIRSAHSMYRKSESCTNIKVYDKVNEDLYFLEVKYNLQAGLHTRKLNWNYDYKAATLSPGTGTDANATLTISPLVGTQPEVSYRMVFWDKEQKCFLLVFYNHKDEPKCEMYQWAEEVHKRRKSLNPPGEIYRSCELEFYKYCGSDVKIVYFYLKCRNAR